MIVTSSIGICVFMSRYNFKYIFRTVYIQRNIWILIIKYPGSTQKMMDGFTQDAGCGQI